MCLTAEIPTMAELMRIEFGPLLVTAILVFITGCLASLVSWLVGNGLEVCNQMNQLFEEMHVILRFQLHAHNGGFLASTWRLVLAQRDCQGRLAPVEYRWHSQSSSTPSSLKSTVFKFMDNCVIEDAGGNGRRPRPARKTYANLNICARLLLFVKVLECVKPMK